MTAPSELRAHVRALLEATRGDKQVSLPWAWLAAVVDEPTPQADRKWTVEEIAADLKVARSTVYARIHDRKLWPVDESGSCITVSDEIYQGYKRDGGGSRRTRKSVSDRPVLGANDMQEDVKTESLVQKRTSWGRGTAAGTLAHLQHGA